MTYPERRAHEDPGGGGQYNPSAGQPASQAHPHAPAGSPKGGQFAPKHGGSGGGKPAPHKPKPLGPLKGTLAYNPGTNRGPGYGVPGGDGHVKALQATLNRLGLKDSRGHGLATDGRLGPLTTSSIKAAQRALGLKPDGRVTPELYNKLIGLKKLPTKPPAKVAATKSAKPSGAPSVAPTKAAKPAPTHAPPVAVRDWGQFDMETRADVVTDSNGEVDAVMEARLVALLTGCTEDEINEMADLADGMDSQAKGY